MKKSVSIHAILTTLSPLHITSPESFRYEIDDASGYGRVKNGSVGGIACSGIQRRRFAPLAGPGLEYGLPVIAANNIAGHMRRKASQILLDVLREKGQRINLQTYSAVTCGAVTGKPDGRDLTFAEYKESASHPFVGLFGGGPRLLPRRMQVLDALPVMEELRSGGFAVRHPTPGGVGHVTDGSQLTSAAAFRRCDDVSDLLDADRMAATVEDFEEKFRARQALIFEDQKKKDADEKGSRNSTKAWSAFEFVRPGVDFDFTINLKGVTPAQIGLFLLALEAFANESLGGQSRNGLGRICLKDVVISEVLDSNTTLSDPVFNENKLIRSHPDVAGYLQAWMDAAKDLTAEGLDAMLKPPEVDEAKVAAKAARDAEKAAKKTKVA